MPATPLSTPEDSQLQIKGANGVVIHSLMTPIPLNLETAVAEFAVAARREVFGYSNYAEDLRTKQMQ